MVLTFTGGFAMADEFRSLKIIAIGAVDTARQVIEYDPEMKNRVSEIHVPLMLKEELKEIIDSPVDSITSICTERNRT
jgi:hypothetical protein